MRMFLSDHHHYEDYLGRSADWPTILISSALPQFCLEIPNPNQYAVKKNPTGFTIHAIKERKIQYT